jgi:hypothetical protein
VVASGEGVGVDVGGTGPVLHREVETEKLANPMVLRNGGEALIK